MISELVLREEVHEVIAEVLLLRVLSSSSVRLHCSLYNPFSARHALCTATGNAECAQTVGKSSVSEGSEESETLGARQWHKR